MAATARRCCIGSMVLGTANACSAAAGAIVRSRLAIAEADGVGTAAALTP
jgi:hypothetical protein